jgi:hypothetical protein
VRSAAPVPPRSSVLPPGAGNEEAKKVLKTKQERANKVEGGYAELKITSGHGHTATIARHDDGDSAAIPVLEEAHVNSC